MKVKKLIFQALAFVVAIAPLAVYLGINFDYYFAGSEKSIGAGVFLIILIALYALKDKFAEIFKHNAQMKISLFLLLVFWGVSKVYNEVILLSFLSFVGSVLSIPFGILARKQAGKIKRTQNFEMTKEAFESVIAINKK
ncbi:MAG: hypothetical protein R3Y18_00455 [Bacillota bacterium]